MPLPPPQRRPLVITLAGQKGGVGKSTLALAIAAEWHRRGLRVLIVDADDEQRTCLTWAEIAAENGLEAPAVHAMGDELRTRLPVLLRSGAWDVALIDCPGRVGRRVTFALGLSDVVLLPCGPTGPEVWAMDRTLEQARDVADVTRRLEIAIVITRRQPGTVIGRRARVVLDEAEVPVLDTELDYRVTYGEAITAGLGPTTYAPESDAAEEVRRLVRELEQRFGLETRTIDALGRRVARRLGFGKRRSTDGKAETDPRPTPEDHRAVPSQADGTRARGAARARRPQA